ncbi:Lysoplasmalogenase-like protein TMEM86A, partial [Armadillidium vulgare]
LKAIGPKLVPFFKTVAIYFLLFIPVGQPSLFAAFIKCLPIISLIAFVLLHGMSLGDEYAYSRRVLLGLIMSAFGDALLVFDETFIHGLGVFFVAQLFYISAFGFQPFNIYVCTVVFGIMSAGLYILMPYVNGALSVGVPLYAIVLMTMVWRAVARVQLFDELWTWTKLCSCIGGILFAISDTCIGFNEFYAKIPYSQVIIMTTYYAAQLGLSLSVVDCKASFLDSFSTSVSSLYPSHDKKVGRERKQKGQKGIEEESSSSIVHSSDVVSVKGYRTYFTEHYHTS